MRAIYAVAVAALFLTGGTISPTADDEKHIEYGAKFRHVAMLRCEVPKTASNPQGLVAASCVIVSPHHVITAAHVVRDAHAWEVTSDDGKSRTLKRVSTHPRYGHGGGSNDLAVGFTEESFGMDWYPAIYEADDERGRLVSVAGYGMRGDFKSGMKDSDGKRRAGSNYIDSAVDDYLICSAASPPWTSLEFLICFGDSGGGLFIGSKLAGINSAIMSSKGKPTGKYGEESIHVRLSQHRDWLLEEIRCNE
jgi:hypothetical protein